MTAKFQLSAVLKAVDNMTPVIKKISRNLKPMGGQFKAIGKNAAVVGGGLKKLLTPMAVLGGAVSIAGIGALVKNTAALGNKMASLSKQTGISATALQEYAYAANFGNMESDEYLRAMEKMSGSMGKLRAGTGPLVSGLNKVSPALLKQLKAAESNEEAFELMLEAIRRVPDESQKLYLATTFFGEAGASMVHMAAYSSAELAKLRTEAHKLGLVLSDEALVSAREFNDALGRAKFAVKGVGMSIGATLLPALAPIIEKISAWIAANRELISAKVGEFIQTIAAHLSKINFDKALNGLGKVVQIIGGLAMAVTSSKGAFIAFIAVMNAKVIVSVLKLGGSILGLVPALYKTVTGMKTVGRGAKAANAPTSALTLKIKALGAGMLNFAKKAALTAISAFKNIALAGKKAGAALATSVVKGFKAASTSALSFAKKAVTSTVMALKSLAVAAKSAGMVLMTGLGDKIKALGGIMTGFVKKAAVAMLTAIKGIALAVKSLTATLLANPIILIITVIALAAYLIIKYWQPIKAFFAKLWDGIVKIFSRVWAVFKKMMPETAEKLVKAWSGIVTFFKALWGNVTQIFKGFLGFAKTAGAAIVSFFGAAWDKLKQAAAGAYDWVAGKWKALTDFMTGIHAAVVGAFSAAWDNVKRIVGGVIEFIKGLLGNLGAWIKNSKVLAPILKVAGAIKGAVDKVRGKSNDDDDGKSTPRAKPPPSPWGWGLPPAPNAGGYMATVGGDPVPVNKPKPQPGALGLAMQGKAPVNEAKAEVVVKFENTPAGVSVNSKTKGKGLDLGTDVGYATPAGLR